MSMYVAKWGVSISQANNLTTSLEGVLLDVDLLAAYQKQGENGPYVEFIEYQQSN